MFVPGGKLPIHRACPDCFGFLGGPRGIVLRSESDMCLVIPESVSVCKCIRCQVTD